LVLKVNNQDRTTMASLGFPSFAGFYITSSIFTLPVTYYTAIAILLPDYGIISLWC